ncbi:MAG: hypothetical protein QXL94_01665 [Candidatus Parvarchaeum sp.]
MKYAIEINLGVNPNILDSHFKGQLGVLVFDKYPYPEANLLLTSNKKDIAVFVIPSSSKYSDGIVLKFFDMYSLKISLRKIITAKSLIELLGGTQATNNVDDSKIRYDDVVCAFCGKNKGLKYLYKKESYVVFKVNKEKLLKKDNLSIKHLPKGIHLNDLQCNFCGQSLSFKSIHAATLYVLFGEFMERVEANKERELK